SAADVALVDGTPAKHRDAERAEVACRNDPRLGVELGQWLAVATDVRAAIQAALEWRAGRDRNRRHTGQSVELIRNPGLELADGLRGRKLPARQGGLDDRYACGVETRGDIPESRDAHHQQHRAAEEHGRQRDLTDHQRRTRILFAGAAVAAV